MDELCTALIALTNAPMQPMPSSLCRSGTSQYTFRSGVNELFNARLAPDRPPLFPESDTLLRRASDQLADRRELFGSLKISEEIQAMHKSALARLKALQKAPYSDEQAMAYYDVLLTLCLLRTNATHCRNKKGHTVMPMSLGIDLAAVAEWLRSLQERSRQYMEKLWGKDAVSEAGSDPITALIHLLQIPPRGLQARMILEDLLETAYMADLLISAMTLHEARKEQNGYAW